MTKEQQVPKLVYTEPALGIAAIIAGSLNSRLAHRYGRVKLSWLGLALFCLGLSAFILFPTYPTTLVSIMFAGFGTSTVVNKRPHDA